MPKQAPDHEKAYQTTIVLLAIGGVIGIYFGFNHFSAYLSNQSPVLLNDAIFNTCAGIITLVTAYLVKQKDKKAMYVVVIPTAMSLIYSWLMGRGFNFISVLVLVVYLLTMNGLKDNGYLK